MNNHHPSTLKERAWVSLYVCVCGCVFVCVRERERARISACVYIRDKSECVWETVNEQYVCTIRDSDVIYDISIELTARECMVIDWLRKWMHVQYDIQHDIFSACHCSWNMDDIFINSCSPPAESSPHSQCTVMLCDHLYTLWAPSGIPVSQHVPYEPASVIVFTEDIGTCSHVVVRAVSFYNFKERLYSQFKSLVLKTKRCVN